MRTGRGFTTVQGLAIAGMLFQCACGGNPNSAGANQEGTSVPPLSVTLSVTPTEIVSGETLPITAQVQGSTNTSVAWAVNGIPNGDPSVGTISGAGNTVTYTAPSSEGTYVLAATSLLDSKKSATARVSVHHASSITSVSVNPASATVSAGAQQQFSVTVTGTGKYNPGIAWSAQRGSITSSGLYTAPAAACSDVVTATSVQNSSKTASASLTVAAVPVTPTITAVTVSPTSGTLNVGTQQQFSATVTGTGSFNSSVTWSAQRGSVSSTGLYTAPATAGGDVVTATSVQNSSKAASASMTVAAAPAAPAITAVTISPTSWTLNMGTQQQFTATVTGTGDFSSSLTWSAQRGTIDSAGLYTAPSTGGSDVVTAMSVQDSTKFATSTITVQSGCAAAPTSSRVVSVKDAAYGAKGDGVTDDTAAIQRAVDAVAGTGGTVTVPDGTYMVNALVQNNLGIRLKSNMTFRLSSGAVLKAIPNASGNYSILVAQSATNLNIIGGTLLGDRAAHTGTSGEWGMGLSIQISQHVVVEGVTAKECWGDGFYVTYLCSDITFCNVVADHNRRQGLSITGVDGMVVRNSIFKNTTGTPPEAGIDIEPNQGETATNILITGCTFTNNSGGGFQGGPSVSNRGQAFMLNTVVDGNTFSGNGLNSLNGIRDGVMVTNCDGTKITNNIITNNTGRGIFLRDQATHTLISGNTVTGTLAIAGQSYWSGGGIYLSSCANSIATNNTVTGNAGFGIIQTSPDATVTVSGNTVSSNGMTP